MSLVSTDRAKRKPALAALSSALLSDILEAASDAAEAWCDRVFASATYTETYNGNATPDLWLRVTPITSLTSITVTDGDGDTESLDVTGDTPDVVFEAANGRVSFGPNNDSSYGRWPRTFPQNIAVVYVAGYDPIPDDVQEAVCLMAIEMLKVSGSAGNIGVKTHRIGEESWTKFDAQTSGLITDRVQALLGRYVREEI